MHDVMTGKYLPQPSMKFGRMPSLDLEGFG